MCLILFAHEAHPGYRLILAANRDEHFSRATAPARFWEDAPALLGGRDLDKGGTWLGITRSGRFAALTNYRGASPPADGRSRGAIVTDFLHADVPPEAFIVALAANAGQYAGFSLLAGDRNGLRYYSNHDAAAPSGRGLDPGVHGLSNHLLNTPWPKVERGRQALAASLAQPAEAREQALLQALRDRVPPPDEALPPGSASFAPDDASPPARAPLAFERALAAPFIHAPERDYGTRCSTLVTVGHDGAVTFVERTWDRSAQATGTVRHHFALV